MTAIVLHHGWGFDASVWDTVVEHLPPGFAVHRTERGYFGASPVTPSPDGSVLAVGHSLGVLHALRAPADALVAINGFTRLCAAPDWPAGIPARPLSRMIDRLAVDPASVLRLFHATHDSPWQLPETCDPARLVADLHLLRDADLRAEWAAFAGPIVALAGEGDVLVTPKLARASFGAATRLVPGGHLLPLTDPALCAAVIAELATRL